MTTTFLMTLRRFIDKLLGVKGVIIDVKFRDWNGFQRHARIQDDQIWGAIKDVLLLDAYRLSYSFVPGKLGCVVDAGAHVGLFSLSVAENAEYVVAIEPSLANFALLTENVRKSGQEGRILPVCAALWKSGGSVEMSEEWHSGAYGMGRPSTVSRRSTSITLHDIIKEHGYVDFMKIDIEGAEYDIIADSAESDLSDIKMIVLELHPEVYGMVGVSGIVSKLSRVGFHLKLFRLPILRPYAYTIRKILNSRLVDFRKLKLLLLLVYTALSLVRFKPNELLLLYAERA